MRLVNHSYTRSDVKISEGVGGRLQQVLWYQAGSHALHSGLLKGEGDTPCIMYARLAQFAKETGDAFIEPQLVALYMAKQDKHISKWRILNCY